MFQGRSEDDGGDSEALLNLGQIELKSYRSFACISRTLASFVYEAGGSQGGGHIKLGSYPQHHADVTILTFFADGCGGSQASICVASGRES